MSDHNCKHEPKKCPRCKGGFECKVGDVANCQCNGIVFTEDQKAFIAARYSDCLCRKCLLELTSQVDFFKAKFDVASKR